MLTSRTVPLTWYVDQLAAGTPFALSRWGDGEWTCLLGGIGRNTDRHAYTAQLRQELGDVLRARPTYLLGLQELVARTPRLATGAARWLARYGLTPAWVNAGVFHRASIADQLTLFIQAITRRGVILVGPAHLRRLAIVPVVAHVVTPDRDCHDVCARMVEATTAQIAQHGPTCVVSISASMSANVIVHQLSQRHPDATLIDVGSLWEPYVGIANRRYHADVIARLRQQAEAVPV